MFSSTDNILKQIVIKFCLVYLKSEMCILQDGIRTDFFNWTLKKIWIDFLANGLDQYWNRFLTWHWIEFELDFFDKTNWPHDWNIG